MGTPEISPGLASAAAPPSELDERTRNRLLRAAVQVFDRKGYAAASVREIVEAAGVTKPALYYHFGSKEGVLAAILEAGAREFDAAVNRAVSRDGSARERVLGLAEDLYGLFAKNVPVVRVCHAVFHGPADTAPKFDFTRFDRSLVRGLKQIVEAGQAAGELREALAEDVALAVYGVIGAAVARHMHPELEPVGDETLRRVIDLVFEGVLKERRS
jgi:AcrR family transcriptional regulator